MSIFVLLLASVVSANDKPASVCARRCSFVVEENAIRIEALTPNDHSSQARFENCVDIVNPTLHCVSVFPVDVVTAPIETIKPAFGGKAGCG